MKIKNKGYSLVELIISIAIFAIVMVGVISMMSTTLKSYSNANIDITVQEDAQIAANQIEELICDARKIYAYDPSAGWKFEDPAGDEYIISYDSSNQKVLLSDGTDTYTIAEHVDSFSLDNWKADSTVTSSTEKAYNQTVINMSMNNKGTSYSLKRNVYFRNDVENSAFHNIDNVISMGGGGGGTLNPGDINLTIRRYETINLTADYRLKSGAKLYKLDGGSWTVITDPDAGTSDNAMFVLTKAANAPDGSYTDVYYVTTGANANSNMDLASDSQFKIVGSNGSSDITIYLKLDAVEIQYAGVVVQQHEDESVNGEGFSSPINVKGIHINEALNSGNFTLEYRYSLAPVQNTPTGYKNVVASDGVVSWGTYTSQLDFNPDRILLGIAPDPFSGGLMVVGCNDRLSTTASSLHGRTDLVLHFSINMVSGTGTKSYSDIPLKFTGLQTGF